jgi:integrase
MSPVTTSQRMRQFLAERRSLGFRSDKSASLLNGFAREMDRQGAAALTVERMAAWARRDKWQRATPATWARRLKRLRPFTRWLRQFDPRTEVPDESIFGAVPGRVTPHIFREEEIEALLAQARRLRPAGGLRPVTFETLFGLIGATGLRVSEALTLRDDEVDLAAATLIVRRSKFGKSRALPLHPSTVSALAHYRRVRCRFFRTIPGMRFFISSRGRRLGQPLSDRQAHRVFRQLSTELGWVNRGAHEDMGIHELRHSFAVRRLTLWYAQGVDIDRAMLSLSTYMGHVKISSTYWYLSAVPELMALAARKFERFASSRGADRA